MVEEQYQIEARLPRTRFTAVGPGTLASGSRTKVEVDVVFAQTPTGLAGVTCRNNAGNYYYGLVGPDGYWRIGRSAGEATNLRDARSLAVYAKNIDRSAPVRVALECTTSGERAVNLKLSVNGVEVGSASDPSALSVGSAGLNVSADVIGEWRFDNFAVTRL